MATAAHQEFLNSIWLARRTLPADATTDRERSDRADKKKNAGH